MTDPGTARASSASTPASSAATATTPKPAPVPDPPLPPPDLVPVATVMAYWYPGAAEAVRMARDIRQRVPEVLGGVYASLAPAPCPGLKGSKVPFDRSSSTKRSCRACSLTAMTAGCLSRRSAEMA